jgi:hypothetical protein
MGVLLGYGSAVDKFCLLFEHADPAIKQIITEDVFRQMLSDAMHVAVDILPTLAVGKPPAHIAARRMEIYTNNLRKVVPTAINQLTQIVFPST